MTKSVVALKMVSEIAHAPRAFSETSKDSDLQDTPAQPLANGYGARMRRANGSRDLQPCSLGAYFVRW